MNFWRQKLENVPCTAEEMEQAAEGAFLLGFYFRNPEEERGLAGITGNFEYITNSERNAKTCYF